MLAADIVAELERLGSPSIKKVLMKHGAREPFFGVKVEDLKKIQKRIKVDHPLALELYATGISDAMYLAGLIADPKTMTKADLRRWAKQAYWYMISEYTVAWVAAESRYGWELAKEWIASPQELITGAGWNTYSSLVSITPDEDLPVAEIRELLQGIPAALPQAQNRVRYSMNNFVICVGSYVVDLHQDALTIARQIGTVEVDMGGTACQVPLAEEAIQKVVSKGRLGKKRKQARC